MSIDVSQTTGEQFQVLQAIYDHFHAHANWPTFIVIDRPLRRKHGIDTAAMIVSMPEALMVPPRPGKLRPVAADELRLTLLGIARCQGGSDDIERFVRLLRWLAEQEMAYEPEPGSSETTPRVTSHDVAVHLHLGDDLAVARLYAMLQLDNWGLSGNGSGDDEWFVTLGPDIWRFRDVQTVEDCIRVREEWVSEGEADVTPIRSPRPDYYHVRVSTKSKPDWDEVRLDLSKEQLKADFLAPYREGRPIVINGKTIPIDDLARLRISTDWRTSTRWLSNQFHQAMMRKKRTYATSDNWLIADLTSDVTDEFITEPPGSAVVSPAEPSQLGSSVSNSYVNQRIIDEIQSKDSKNQFNVAKLLRLIEELNDNCERRNSYASHALLRAILDHIPPILGQSDFNAVANNYPWGRTDKRYLKKLADFRDQADDALHRQISTQADLLDFEDMPASICVDRLLQECATRLSHWV